MRVLLPDNTSFNMNDLPNPDINDSLLPGEKPYEYPDVRYCVLDYSDAKDVDFYWIPMIFLDQFPRPAADLQIGKYRIQMPLSWSVVIADKNFGHMEVISLTHLDDRDFDAFVLNPINSYMPDFGEISILNVFPDVTWTMPKLKYGHILAVPLEDGPAPRCAFFVQDSNRLPESLDLTKVFC